MGMDIYIGKDKQDVVAHAAKMAGATFLAR